MDSGREINQKLLNRIFDSQHIEKVYSNRIGFVAYIHFLPHKGYGDWISVKRRCDPIKLAENGNPGIVCTRPLCVNTQFEYARFTCLPICRTH